MMMTTIFTTVLNMSLTAGYCIIVVILLRFLLKRQPKILSYLLWSVVLFRLLCPVSLTSGFSLLRMDTDIVSQENFMGQHTVENTLGNNLNAEAAQKTEEGSDVSELPPVVQQEQYQASGAQTFLVVGAWVWFTGAVLFILYGILSAYRLKRYLQKAVCVEDNLYEAEKIPSPFVFGIVCPRIYLPTGLSAQERRYVVEHERVHAARKDYLVKILAWFARCIHWFNPLSWLFFALMENDMEMSCDEAVLRKLGMEAKEDYSRALLSLSCDRMEIGGCPPAFGEGRVKDRIRNVLTYRRRTAATVAVIAVLLLAIVLGLSLNPMKRGDGETEELLRLGEKDQLVNDYANAWCNRDGETIAGLYIDEDTAFQKLPMLEKAGGEYSFGFSSPWPDEFWRTIPTGEGTDKGTSEIRYYAWTSDPHVAVWKEEITFVKTEAGDDGSLSHSGYRITDSTLTYFDSITTEEEYMDAYWGDGEYHFTDYVERGFVEAINFQTEYDTENGEDDRNAVYRTPETAAEYIMNLIGGTGTAKTASDGTAVVEYTFGDGSSVLIPMKDANFDARTDNTQQDGTGEAGQTEMEHAVNNEVWILDLDVWNAGAP
ncbi:MAG: M56 family metallopeptidase [Lachnospiraceae bacterium]|nr:M56 family metallopeptidase [Lachnospiraceae bacterium]